MNFNKYLSFLKWINKYVTKDARYDALADYWIKLVAKWVDTQGAEHTVKRIKAIRLHVTRYLCKHPLRSPQLPGMGLNRLGLPRKLGPLQDLINGSVQDKRFLLTLLSVSRVIPCAGKIDLSSITDPGKPVPPYIMEEMENCLNKTGFLSDGLSKDNLLFESCHLSTKSGPNGQAMGGSVHDAHNIPDSLLKLIRTVGGENLYQRVLSIVQGFNQELWQKVTGWRNKSSIRKLSVVHAPEGKERVIAIFDYWSQAALLPLHNEVMRWLRRHRTDKTYKQTQVFESLPFKGPYYSLDLTAATDRFPVELQVLVLKHMFQDEEYAKAWHQIMVGYPMDNPWGPPVTYATGQPMGAYSSWAVFAASHHCVVMLAAERAGLNGQSLFSDYALLGDDVVIANEAVATEYINLMTELGVSISESKSHVSQDMFEFAKRWYQDGVEISGIQLSQFSEIENWSQLAESITTALERWDIKAHEMDRGSIIALLGVFNQRPRDVDKFLKYLHLPRQGDSEAVRTDKLNFLSTALFPSVFGCFPRYKMRSDFILQTLAEVKTAKIESAMKASFQVAQSYFSKLGSSELALGMEDQSLLLLLPAIESVRSEIMKAQDMFGKLRSMYWDSDEELIFSSGLMTLTDPSRLMVSRRQKVLISTNASLVNEYKRWAANYVASRTHLLEEDEPISNVNPILSVHAQLIISEDESLPK